MNLFFTQLFYQAGFLLFVLLMCYIIIKIIVKKELESSLPNQVKEAINLFKGKPMRLVLRISSNGKVDFESFEPLEPASYVG